MAERILVIDDEKIILELTSLILRSRGYEVFTCDTGPEGLELVEKLKPEVVLLDYMMPVMDGMTTMRRIREGYPETYVIMFTGKGSEEIAVELMKAGASDYILKPFQNKNLADRVENVLRMRRIEIQNKKLREEKEKLLREIEQWNQELERRVEEKSNELEKAHAEILQSEKLATLGHLSAGMAHEIRNPLNSISLFAQLLKESLSDDPDNAQYAAKTLKEVDRIDNILIKLLNASKRPKYELKLVSIQQIIESVLEGVEEQLRVQKIDLQTSFEDTPPQILADPTEIEQIFTNLITNSLYEMKQGGGLGISLRHDNKKVYIDVSDTGGGIPEENLRNIFDPFFSTKSRGTGFGLSVVLRIVKNYGGSIQAESVEGSGTTIHIELPFN